jgi:hypothetical protein
MAIGVSAFRRSWFSAISWLAAAMMWAVERKFSTSDRRRAS